MLSPGELVASITAAAVSASQNLSAVDTALLSAVFMQFGDTLATIAAAKAKYDLLHIDSGNPAAALTQPD